MSEVRLHIQKLLDQIGTEIIGQQHVLQGLTIALLTNSHVLLEGLPGTAKTRSIKTLAKGLSASLGRIQFTPDLLPSDVTGTETYRESASGGTLSFQPGPVFNNLVLADEINRAPAKVQSALLEAMGEGQLTVAGETHKLPELFMVMATQNPIEQEGTYPLPEAQMDRFLMKITVGYPDLASEMDIVRLVRDESLTNETSQDNRQAIEAVQPALILQARREVQTVHMADTLLEYLVSLVMATRQPGNYPDSPLAQWLQSGASPRASIALDKAARAHAWLMGRDYVEPDDIRAVAHEVLGHRVMLSYDAVADGIRPAQVVDELLAQVALV